MATIGGADGALVRRDGRLLALGLLALLAVGRAATAQRGGDGRPGGRDPGPRRPGRTAVAAPLRPGARLAGALAGRQAVSSDGPIADWRDDRYRGRHVAVDCSGLVDGRPAGIAILDDPRNPGSPTPWYVVRSSEMSFFSPAVLCYGPRTLDAGERLALRYRVVVPPGRWDPARLKAEQAKLTR